MGFAMSWLVETDSHLSVLLTCLLAATEKTILGHKGEVCSEVWQELHLKGSPDPLPGQPSKECLELKHKMQRFNSLALRTLELWSGYLRQCKEEWLDREQNLQPTGLEVSNLVLLLLLNDCLSNLLSSLFSFFVSFLDLGQKGLLTCLAVFEAILLTYQQRQNF